MAVLHQGTPGQMPWLKSFCPGWQKLAPWLTEISINSISSEVHNSAQKLIYLSLVSLIIYHYLSSITSRLRTPSLYHRPATHTKRYTSFIHYALLKYHTYVKHTLTLPPSYLKIHSFIVILLYHLLLSLHLFYG